MGQLLSAGAEPDIETNALLYGCDECGDKFMSKMMRDEHRIHVHSQSITVLPPEVFENILDFLHPNDLINISQTCRKYKDFVPEYFGRKHQCASVKIHFEYGIPKFDFYHKPKYEIYFRSAIRNVMVYKGCGQSAEQLFQFIRMNCSKNIQSFACQYFNRSDESNMEIIWDQIEHLNVLALNYANIFDPIADSLHGNYKDYGWITKTFPNLHTLHLSCNYAREQKLTEFFRNNMQIKTFSFVDAPMIQSILSSNIQLSHLVYHPFGEKYMENSMDKIEKCYNQIDVLDLDTSWITGWKRIAQMEKVKIIHYRYSLDDIKFPYIQQLCVHFFKCDEREQIKRIAKDFPNLSKLLITAYLKNVSHNEFVSILIATFPKLKHLYLEFNDDRDESYDLKEWNSVRMKNAPVLTIHVHEYDMKSLVPFESNRVIVKPYLNMFFNMFYCSDLMLKLDYLRMLRREYHGNQLKYVP